MKIEKKMKTTRQFSLASRVWGRCAGALLCNPRRTPCVGATYVLLGFGGLVVRPAARTPIRTIIYWGLYWGPPVLGNYHNMCPQSVHASHSLLTMQGEINLKATSVPICPKPCTADHHMCFKSKPVCVMYGFSKSQ